jgi:hypothetical protein
VLGLTVAGEIRNYTRVTDEMLRNPPAGDWPMLRRDQSPSDFSPLNQITRDNVGQLQLAWVAPMSEAAPTSRRRCARRRHLPQQQQRHLPGARRQDRRSDLGAAPRREPAMRGMSLYDDKLFWR